MEENIAFLMDEVPVRFTRKGSVFVLDAIRAVSDCNEAADLWEQIKRRNPDLLSSVTELKTKDARPVPVVDSEGWEKIQETLVDMILFRKNEKEQDLVRMESGIGNQANQPAVDFRVDATDGNPSMPEKKPPKEIPPTPEEMPPMEDPSIPKQPPPLKTGLT